MGRKRRSLWGAISTSEKADQVTDTEFLLYLLIIPHCDDEGRMQGKPKTVKNKTCPGRSWTAGRIEKMLTHLDEVELIEYYSVNGCRYIQVTQWEEHQTFHGITREDSKYPTNNGLSTQPTLVKNSTNPGSKGSEVKGSEVNRSEVKCLELYTPAFLKAKAEYPKRRGNQNYPGAFKRWEKLLANEDVTEDLLIRACRNYRLEQESIDKAGTEYVMMMSTFFGQDHQYVTYMSEDFETDASPRDPEETREYVRQFKEGEKDGTLKLDKEKRQVIVVATGEMWQAPGKGEEAR